MNPKSNRGSKQLRYKGSFSFTQDELASAKESNLSVHRLRKLSNAPQGSSASGRNGGGFASNLDHHTPSDLMLRTQQAPEAAKYMVNRSPLDMQKQLHTSQGQRNLIDRSRNQKESPFAQQSSHSPPRSQLAMQDRGQLYSQEVQRRPAKNAAGFVSASDYFAKGSLAANVPTHPTVYTAQAGNRMANQRFVSQAQMQPFFGRPGTVSQYSL